jgi:hypothetical protein
VTDHVRQDIEPDLHLSSLHQVNRIDINCNAVQWVPFAP